MVRRFTRKFDPQKPRDYESELYDTHQARQRPAIPRAPIGSVLVLPGSRPHALYHSLHDCVALVADTHLAEHCGHEARVTVSKLKLVRTMKDRVGCVLCLPTETDYTKIKNCLISADSGSLEGMLLQWRRDRTRRWHGIVVYKLRTRLVADIRAAGELQPLPARQ